MSQSNENIAVDLTDVVEVVGFDIKTMPPPLYKRVFDLSASVLLIILLSPFMVLIAFLIAIDGGSPIYRQRRIGHGGSEFECLKFRSMILNSREVLEELLASDAEARAEWEATQKLRNDPRITGIGHFIRKTSLDELPQLFNVVKGEMSLVGPRPIVRDEIVRYGTKFRFYKSVRPGLTGLWQVSGRSDTSYDHRVDLDCRYVRDRTFVMDITILVKTVGVVLGRRGAC